MKASKRGRNGHTNEAFWGGLAATDSRSRIFDVIEDVQCRLVKVATCLSECNRTRGAVNEFSAEFILKGRDLFADGGLTNSTFLGDRGETPFFNDSDEHLHCIQFVHTSLPIPLWNGCYARNSDSSALVSEVKNTGLKKIPSSARCIPIGNRWYSPECQICSYYGDIR